jgi:MFS family permease
MTAVIQNTSHARLPREARILVAARLVDRLGGFTMTFLPLLLVTAYGASLRTAGLVTAVFGLATIPSRLLGGRLADRLGRRPTIVAGLTGCAVAQLTLAAAPTLTAAALAAVALGLCFEVYEPPSQALLADVVTPDQRPAAFSALGVAIAAAGVLAGVLAAVLAGFGLRWLFVADAVTCLACALTVLVGLRGGPPAVKSGGSSPGPWRDRRLLAMFAAGTGFATMYMVIIGGLPLALHREGVAGGWAGALVALSAVTVVVGQRARRLLPGHWDPFARMRMGYALMALGLACALPAALAHTGTAYVVPVVVWSLGTVVLLGEPLAVVAGLAPESGRGRYVAAYGVCWGLATTAAPVLATGLLATGGPPLMWASCSALAMALAAGQRRLGTAVTRR